MEIAQAIVVHIVLPCIAGGTMGWVGTRILNGYVVRIEASIKKMEDRLSR